MKIVMEQPAPAGSLKRETASLQSKALVVDCAAAI
jgi:hypothetical protein